MEQGIKDDHIIALAIDDFMNQQYLQPEALYRYVTERTKDNEMHYVLLDEIQLVEGFEAVLNGFLHRDNLDVYVTGSNSRFLSTDIITEFRGRGDEIRVSPFRFADICTLYDEHPQVLLSKYFRFGGMPKVWQTEKTEEREQYLKNLFEQVYLADIIGRYDLRGKAEIGDLVNILASSVGSLTNPLRLTNTFKSELGKVISQNTVNAYIEYLVDSFLVSRANRYDVKGLKYISSPLKYYFTDIGLRNARINFRQQDESHIMENIIYNELLRRRYSVDVGSVTTNAKNAEGKMVRKNLEVDFIANKGDKRYYIQSALELSTEEKWKQEEQSLLSISDSFKKIVIQRQMIEPWYNNHGILCISVEDFLLNQDSLDW
jgi:predicted AAA+ superfamily ATPase